MARVVIGFVFALALLPLSGVRVSAQMELAVIKGTIVDDTGAPLEGVSIRLVNVDRGREVTLTSDKNGRFYRRGLQAVEYEMSVAKDGYQPISDKVRLVAGADRDFDFTLAKANPMGAEEFQQGVAAYNKGDFQAAAGAFEAAIAKAPEIPDLYVNLALAYFRLDRQAEAVSNLEKAASLGPDQPAIHYQLGSAYIEMQAYDKAVAALEKGLASKPDLATDALAVEAMSSLGAVYFAEGQVDKAAAAFEQVLAAKPDAAGALLGMGKVQFSRGDAAKALSFFEQVVAGHPGTPEAVQADAFIKELKKGAGAR